MMFKKVIGTRSRVEWSASKYSGEKFLSKRLECGVEI